MVIIFNTPGIVQFLLCFGLTSVALGALGISAEGPVMIVAGPLLAASDLVFRAKRGGGQWFRGDQGGSLFFLPAWIFGVIWFLLGIGYTVSG